MTDRIVRSREERAAILLARGFDLLERAGEPYCGDRKPWAAAALLMRSERGDVGTANRILLEWSAEQNHDARSPHFGTGHGDAVRSQYEAASFPTPSLYNAFAAPALAVIFRRFRGNLTRRTERASIETMKAGLFEFLQRDLPLRGMNQSIGMSTGLIIYGALLDQPAVLKKGLYRLVQYLETGAYMTPMDEYNSPTYAATDLILLAGALEIARRRDVRVAVRLAMERLSLVIACHYHPPTHELAPPHYRAYHGTLSKYAGGLGPVIFKMTGDLRLIDQVPHGLHDVHVNFAAAALDLRIGSAMRKLFLDKTWPFEVREVRSYAYAGLPADVNPWPEVTAFYPDHEKRCARVLAAGVLNFDEARPRDVATTYMTGSYALGTFSESGTLATPFGYGTFHRRGLQFYYRRDRKSDGRTAPFGFVAFPNADKGGPDNLVECLSAGGQYRNVALALYRMRPERASACEIFCPLQAADGTETFHDSRGHLARGKGAKGAVFVEHGDCYLAFLKTARPAFVVQHRGPQRTGYVFDGSDAIPTVVLSHYRGRRRDFQAGTCFEGAVVFAIGDAREYGSFHRFRHAWSRARLRYKADKGNIEASVSGVGPALRLRVSSERLDEARFYVSGKLQTCHTLECALARQSLRGEDLQVGGFTVSSGGKPVTAYAAPDGSGCVVIQPLPVPVDITIASKAGITHVKGMPLGRVELAVPAGGPARVAISSAAPPKNIQLRGGLSEAHVRQVCGRT